MDQVLDVPSVLVPKIACTINKVPRPAARLSCGDPKKEGAQREWKEGEVITWMGTDAHSHGCMHA